MNNAGFLVHFLKEEKMFMRDGGKRMVEVATALLIPLIGMNLLHDDTPSKRKVKLDQINQGHFQVLLTTGQLMGEGLDIPALDCLFLVYPFSFEGKLIQYVGRIQRSKSTQTVYDYRDTNIAFCEKLFKKRNTFYRKRGWIT